MKKLEVVKFLAAEAKDEVQTLAKARADSLSEYIKLGDKIDMLKSRGNHDYWMSCEIAGEINSAPNLGYYLNVDVRNLRTGKIHSLSLSSGSYRTPSDKI